MVLALGAVFVIDTLIFVIGMAISGKLSEQETTDKVTKNCGGSRFSYETDYPNPDSEADKLIKEINLKISNDSY